MFQTVKDQADLTKRLAEYKEISNAARESLLADKVADTEKKAANETRIYNAVKKRIESEIELLDETKPKNQKRVDGYRQIKQIKQQVKQQIKQQPLPPKPEPPQRDFNDDLRQLINTKGTSTEITNQNGDVMLGSVKLDLVDENTILVDGKQYNFTRGLGRLLSEPFIKGDVRVQFDDVSVDDVLNYARILKDSNIRPTKAAKFKLIEDVIIGNAEDDKVAKLGRELFTSRHTVLDKIRDKRKPKPTTPLQALQAKTPLTPVERIKKRKSKTPKSPTKPSTKPSIKPEPLPPLMQQLGITQEEINNTNVPEIPYQGFSTDDEEGDNIKGFGVKHKPYRLIREGDGLRFGGLIIDPTELSRFRLRAYNGANVVIDKKFDPTFFELITKRFNPRIPYTYRAVKLFRHLVDKSGAPIQPLSRKHKLLTGMGGLMTPDGLAERLKVILGSIQAGNNSHEMINEAMAIADNLLNSGAMSKIDHKKIFNTYIRPFIFRD